MTDTPWLDEPDELDGAYGDVPWALRRGLHGQWNGYVAVPHGHPWRGLCSIEVPANVHGGVTWSAHADATRDDLPQIQDAWWVAFDCGHLDDRKPMQEPLECSAQTYRTVDYARAEVESLARQAAEAMANTTVALDALRGLEDDQEAN